MAQKSFNFVSMLIWQCKTGKPALPFKLNEGPQCALLWDKYLYNILRGKHPLEKEEKLNKDENIYQTSDKAFNKCILTIAHYIKYKVLYLESLS